MRGLMIGMNSGSIKGLPRHESVLSESIIKIIIIASSIHALFLD